MSDARPMGPVGPADSGSAPADAGSAPADDLAFALALAARAGEILMDRYERLERIDYKSARDIVTEADHLSEALILDAIRARYPGDGLIAEETGEHHSGGGEAPTTGLGRVWVVDPLDGTINYANGIPFFCVSIGLAVDGRPSVGVIHDPTRGESFGATANGQALLAGSLGQGSHAVRASDKEQLSDFVVSIALGGRAAAARSSRVRKTIRISRSMGSAALALAYVANGRFDAFIQQAGLSNWDILAAGLIAERAGATVTTIDGGAWFDIGRPSKTISLLAAPATHHATLLGLVR